MSEEKKSYKVNDRRRFDEAGNERDSGTQDAPASVQSNQPAQKASSPTSASGSSIIGTPSYSDRAYSDRTSADQADAAQSQSSQAHPQGDFVLSNTESETDSPRRESNSEEGQAGQGGRGPHLSFSSFVMSLATQCLMQLGEIEPPGGMRLPPDFEAAQQSVEILGMLAIKTKGNLDAEEQRLLAEVLHSVRLAFVQRMKAAAAGAASPLKAKQPAGPQGSGPRGR